MAKILVRIEVTPGSEYCEACRFLSEREDFCMLFEQEVFCDATMDFSRCGICVEGEESEAREDD